MSFAGPRTEDPVALGLCRAVIVAVLTLAMVTHCGAVAEYFSDAGWVNGPEAREAFPTRWSWFFWFPDPLAVRLLFALGVIAHLFWLVGAFTLPAAIVSALSWISLLGRNPLLFAYPDQLAVALAVLLACMPTGAGFSVDAWRRGHRLPVSIAWRWLIQLQLALVYTSTGLLKTGPAWRDGTALYYALVNPNGRHFDAAVWLAEVQPWLLAPATWIVRAWEIGFVGFMLWCWVRETSHRSRWLPDIRGLYLGFGVMMHVGIQLMMYVLWFGPLSLSVYTAFLQPHEAERCVQWLRATTGRWPRAA